MLTCLSVTFVDVGGFDQLVGRERKNPWLQKCFWNSGPQFKRITRGELSWTDICPVQGLLSSLSDHSASVCVTTFSGMNTEWCLIPFLSSFTSCPGRSSLWDDWGRAESRVSALAPLSAVQGLAQDQHCSAAEDVVVFIGVLLSCEELSPYGLLRSACRF